MPDHTITIKVVEGLSKIWDYTFDVWSEAQADQYYFLYFLIPPTAPDLQSSLFELRIFNP